MWNDRKNHRKFVGILVPAGGLFTGTVYSFFLSPGGLYQQYKEDGDIYCVTRYK